MIFEIDYQAITEAGGNTKTDPAIERKKGLKAITKVKAHYEPIPKDIKEAVLEVKGTPKLKMTTGKGCHSNIL